MSEAPWPAGPVDATLDWSPIEVPGKEHVYDGIGTLWFLSPETEGYHAGQRCPIHISATCGPAGTVVNRSNVWQVTDNGDGTVTVRPSVHFVGHFHSPNPVMFRLVDTLPEVGS